jgi:haloacid dehalogenase-like hydrolase
MSVLTLDEARASDFSRHDGQVRPEAGSTFDLPLSIPLVVDLDGTLIAGDMFYKSFFAALARNPFIVLPCIGWFWRGRAALKRELALRCRIDVNRLKLHQDVLALLLREKAAGRSVVLATAADALLAEPIAARLRIFDRVIASDGSHNLKGPAKAQALTQLFPGGFIYAGDSKADLPVWRRARAIVVVNARKSVAAAARALGRPTLELTGRIAR